MRSSISSRRRPRPGASGAFFLPVRLPYEVAPLFRAWLDEHFPDRADKVMNIIRSMRGGRDNDPNWFTRMQGSGPWAELLRDALRDRGEEARAEPGQAQAPDGPVRAAAGAAAAAALAPPRAGEGDREGGGGVCSLQYPSTSFAWSPPQLDGEDSGRARQLVVPILLAQRGLEQLAGRGVRAGCRRTGSRPAATIWRRGRRDGRGSAAGVTSEPALRTTSSSGRSSHLGCLTPTAAASATPGQPTAAFSRSIELIHSPPDLITSLERSVICSMPSGWRTATSPVSNQPSVVDARRPSRPGNIGG